jgi:Co/Zn/Cd efflux system component
MAFSNFVIALVVGGGVGFWLFNKFQHSNGGNSKNSAIGSAVVAIFITIAGTIILHDCKFNWPFSTNLSWYLGVKLV